LPEGFFSDQKSQFWYILECLKVENVLVIWTILRPLGLFYGHLVISYIFPTLVYCTKKSGIPGREVDLKIVFEIFCPVERKEAADLALIRVPRQQGDQIGRIFDFWAIRLLWVVFFENYRRSPNYWATFFLR
jgi:hypothetical protein